MYSGRRRRKPELNSNINMTNLVDVMLTILIIFILVAPFIEKGIAIDLPKSESKQDIREHQLVIKVSKDGEIYIGPVQVNAEELERRLRSIAAAKADITVNLEGDAGANYQAIVGVLDIVRRSGITSIGLATEVKMDK